MPASASLTNGQATMQVDRFVLASGGRPLPVSSDGFLGALGSSESQVIGLGVRPRLAPVQAAGIYSGSCNVTVDYQ
jgi:hypothetical protein